MMESKRATRTADEEREGGGVLEHVLLALWRRPPRYTSVRTHDEHTAQTTVTTPRQRREMRRGQRGRSVPLSGRRGKRWRENSLAERTTFGVVIPNCSLYLFFFFSFSDMTFNDCGMWIYLYSKRCLGRPRTSPTKRRPSRAEQSTRQWPLTTLVLGQSRSQSAVILLWTTSQPSTRSSKVQSCSSIRREKP